MPSNYSNVPHCSLYNNIKPPSWVTAGADFHLFKKGIEPKWEDPKCEHGGKWTVLIPRGPNGKQTMDTYWLNAVGGDTMTTYDDGSNLMQLLQYSLPRPMCQSLCTSVSNIDTLAVAMHLCLLVQIMAAIGEQFTEGEEICGSVVNLRARQDRLCIWTKTASNEAAQVDVDQLI